MDQGQALQLAWDNAGAITANIAVGIVFLGLIVAGVKRGLKELRELRPADVTGANKPEALTVVSSMTLLELSASNRENANAVDNHRGATDRNTGAVHDLIDEIRSLRRDLETLRQDRRG